MNSVEFVPLKKAAEDPTSRIARPVERQDRSPTGAAFAINGRFYGQPVTGVQRYAREIV